MKIISILTLFILSNYLYASQGTKPAVEFSFTSKLDRVIEVANRQTFTNDEDYQTFLKHVKDRDDISIKDGVISTQLKADLELINYEIESEEQLQNVLQAIRSKGIKDFDYIHTIVHPKSGPENFHKEGISYTKNGLRSSILNLPKEFKTKKDRREESIIVKKVPILSSNTRAPSSTQVPTYKWWNDKERLGKFYNKKGRMYLSIARFAQNGGVTYYGLQAIGMPLEPSVLSAFTTGSLSGVLNYYNDFVSDLLGTLKYEIRMKKDLTRKFRKDLRKKINLKASLDAPKPKFTNVAAEFIWTHKKWFGFEYVFLSILESVKYGMDLLGHINIYAPLTETAKGITLTSIKSLGSQGLYDTAVARDFSPRSDDYDKALEEVSFSDIKRFMKESELNEIQRKDLQALVDRSSFRNNDMNQKFMELLPPNENLSVIELERAILEFKKEYKLSKSDASKFLFNSKKIKDKAEAQFRNSFIGSEDVSINQLSEKIKNFKGAVQLKRMVWTMAGSAAWALAAILDISGVPAGDIVFASIASVGAINHLRLFIFKPKIVRTCSDYM